MRLQKAFGNMYDWVTHMWGVGTGCPHQCKYCYVKANGHEQPDRFVLDPEFPHLGKDKTIFVGHRCDLFAESVNTADILRVLDWCRDFPENTYVFQSKNPERAAKLMEEGLFFNLDVQFGTTIETNRTYIIDELSKTPPPLSRALGLSRMKCRTFLTIEPILTFDQDALLNLVLTAKPKFVNIGADSKGHDLPEPSRLEVLDLICVLIDKDIEIRQKYNLDRLL